MERLKELTQPTYLFRNRLFTRAEIERIKEITAQYWAKGRWKISQVICEDLNWRQANGRLKEVACREALRKMAKLGFINLPPKKSNGGFKIIKPLTADEVGFQKPPTVITGNLKHLGPISFTLASTHKEVQLWRYLIQRYHYLGYKIIVGRYLKYFIYLDEDLVALLGFADGIYHHHLRDHWIGWNKETQQNNRHLVVNNCRFLILPWIKIKNLASKILSLAVKIMPQDWAIKYGYRPLLVETFVDCERFKGTCYKAANWIYLGKTEGKGRRGAKYFYHGRVRDYYVYPLIRNAISMLKGDDDY